MKYIFLFLMLIGTIFIDLPLAQKIGTIGKSLMVFISPIIASLIYFFSTSAKKLLRRFDVKLFLGYWLITFLFSLLMLNVYTIATGNTYTIYGQNMFIKLLKASTYNLILALTYYNFTYIFSNLNYKKLSFVFFLIFILLTVVGFSEIYNKDIFNMFHNTPLSDNRVRLLTSEPSQAGLLYGIFLFLALIFNKFFFLRIIFLTVGLIIFYFIASKVALITIILSIALVYFLGINFKQKIKYSVIIFPTLGVLIYIFIPVFLSSLLSDIENFSSFSTRFTGFISAILTLVYYPVGFGYGTYLTFFPSIAEEAKSIAENVFPLPLNFYEIDIIIATGENIGFKSGFLSQIMFNGWIAILFFTILFTSTYRRIDTLNLKTSQKIISKTLIIFIILEIFTAVDIEVMYAYLIPIAIIYNFYYESLKDKIQ